MKRFLKILGIIIGVVVLIFVGFALFINFKPPTQYKNEARDLTITPDSAKVAEGARIASLLCKSCHMSEDGKLGGGFMPDTKVFGKIYAPNITHSDKARIHGYTDGQLVYLFRTGIKKDGYYAPPWMPKFPLMSDHDIECIVAFLRSDHPMVQPSDLVQPAPEPSFLAKALLFGVFKPLPYPEQPIPEPDTTNKVEFGKYLATAKFDCYSCHSADFATNNEMEPSKSIGFFGGGNKLLNREGKQMLSANITMDAETGIGNWTEAQFIKCVKYGERPSGVATRYPMEPWSNLTDEEVSAIWAYLQTVPKISYKVVLPES
ncbi:MAG: c-type cytochrome [Bacteroidetes bacterium]|nr:c-type cytochrome [Bacteroidota bacterium]